MPQSLRVGQRPRNIERDAAVRSVGQPDAVDVGTHPAKRMRFHSVAECAAEPQLALPSRSVTRPGRWERSDDSASNENTSPAMASSIRGSMDAEHSSLDGAEHSWLDGRLSLAARLPRSPQSSDTPLSQQSADASSGSLHTAQATSPTTIDADSQEGDNWHVWRWFHVSVLLANPAHCICVR